MTLDLSLSCRLTTVAENVGEFEGSEVGEVEGFINIHHITLATHHLISLYPLDSSE